MEQQVRVLVQSTDYLSMVGLTTWLESSPEIMLVTGEERASADVVVMAADELSTEVVTKLDRAVVEAPIPVVLVLNEIGAVDPVTVAECWIVAVIPRSAATRDQVVRSVLAAASGESMMPPKLVKGLLEHARSLKQELAEPTTASGQLTAREIDVLRMLADGQSTVEIARTLSCSVRTAKYVLYGITTRLNLRNRSHAVAYALRKGLI